MQGIHLFIHAVGMNIYNRSVRIETASFVPLPQWMKNIIFYRLIWHEKNLAKIGLSTVIFWAYQMQMLFSLNTWKDAWGEKCDCQVDKTQQQSEHLISGWIHPSHQSDGVPLGPMLRCRFSCDYPAHSEWPRCRSDERQMPSSFIIMCTSFTACYY